MLGIREYIRRKVAPDYEFLQRYILHLQQYEGFWPKFVDKQIVEHQLESEITTDGTQKEICVLFTDVRGFTSFSEKSSLIAANSFLNNFYDIVIEHTHDHGGIIDKFMGDGTMSIFGVFDDGDDYVLNAVNCARSILQDFDSMTSQKDEPSLFLGVGLSKGPAMVGTFGNGDFVSFTAIGHTVNLAARIQAKAKNNKLLITKEVAKYLPKDEIESKGKFELKNVSKPVELFEVL